MDNLSGGAVALEATLTAIKGAGWSTETLKVIKDAITALNNLSASDVWAYVSRTLTTQAFPFTNPATPVQLDNVRVALYSDPLNIIRDAILTDATKFPGADIPTILSEIQSGSYGLSVINTNITTLLNRLTATRAGYLDNLSGGAVATQVALDRKVLSMTFVSTTNAPINISATAGDITFNSIVVSGIPSGATIIKALVFLITRAIENTSSSGTNNISGAQNVRIKKSTGAWGTDDITAIPLINGMWSVNASTKDMGDVKIGDDASDVKTVVDGNATYDLRITSAKAVYDFLRLHDVQMMLKIWFY